jgi:hypothetical protein
MQTSHTGSVHRSPTLVRFARSAYDFGRLAAAAPKRFVVFVDETDGLLAVRERFGADNILAISTGSVGAGVRKWRRETLEMDFSAVVDAHRARPFSGVIYWREPYVVVAARLAQRLGVPAVLPDPLLARDKVRMKDALRPAVRCAEVMPVRDATDIERAQPRFFPGVLKPRYAFASICAVRVDDVRTARREFAEKRDKLLTAHLERVDLGVPMEPEFVLESLVGGSEHTVESFVADSEVVLQIVSDKRPMAPPHFVETGDVMPSILDEASQVQVCAAARRAIAALGIRYGWTHAEIKLWRGEPWVIEIGARMGGGYTRDIVQAVYGLNMLQALFDYVATGSRPSLGPARCVALGRRFVVSGVSVVWNGCPVDRLPGNGHVTFVPRESARRRRGVLLGVPYSYGGTVAAYLFSAEDKTELDRLDAEVGATLAPRLVEIPMPRSWYRAYLVAKRVLDGLGHG